MPLIRSDEDHRTAVNRRSKVCKKPLFTNRIECIQVEREEHEEVMKETEVSASRSEATQGLMVDALAPNADEGRGILRKASGSRIQALIRGCPNGETPRCEPAGSPG